jgi:hypothetical protein
MRRGVQPDHHPQFKAFEDWSDSDAFAQSWCSGGSLLLLWLLHLPLMVGRSCPVGGQFRPPDTGTARPRWRPRKRRLNLAGRNVLNSLDLKHRQPVTKRCMNPQDSLSQNMPQNNERDIVLRSLREGIDTSTAAGRMVAGVLASLAELELELGKDRRAAAREARRARGQAIGRPKALDASKAELARRMHASGEPATTVAAALGVSRATVYRILAEESGE